MALGANEIGRIAELFARVEASRSSRRRLLTASAAGAAAFALSRGGTRVRAQDEVKALTIMSYGGIYGDNQKTAVFDSYQTETGVKLNIVTGQSAIPVLTADAVKDDPDYDVVLLTNIEFVTVRNQGDLLAAYDQNNVPNLADLWPIANQMPYAANVELDPWGIMYNTEVVSPAPDSWAALWDMTYHGKVAFEPPTSGGDEVFNLLACSLVAGGTVNENRIARIAATSWDHDHLRHPRPGRGANHGGPDCRSRPRAHRAIWSAHGNL